MPRPCARYRLSCSTNIDRNLDTMEMRDVLDQLTVVSYRDGSSVGGLLSVLVKMRQVSSD